jgi:hypothetical protein
LDPFVPLEGYLNAVRPSEGQVSSLSDAVVAANAALAGSRGDRSPESLAALDEHLTAIREARGEFSAYVKTLPYTGRYRDAAWVANQEAGRVVRNLTKRLKGSTSGRPRDPAPIEGPAEITGMLGRAVEVIDAIAGDKDFAAMANLWDVRHSSGIEDMWLISRSEMRAKADTLIAELDRTMRQLSTHWLRYENGFKTREKAAQERYHRRRKPADNPHLVRVAYNDTLDRVDYLRERARDLRRNIDAVPDRARRPASPAPLRKPYERWTEDDIRASRDAFREREGRAPTRRDHDESPDLPSYSQLRRTMGIAPISKLID